MSEKESKSVVNQRKTGSMIVIYVSGLKQRRNKKTKIQQKQRLIQGNEREKRKGEIEYRYLSPSLQ